MIDYDHNMTEKTDKIIGVSELAKFFGVSDQTIWRWCKSGKIPSFKIGGQWKIRQSDLNRIINQKVGKPEAGGREKFKRSTKAPQAPAAKPLF